MENESSQQLGITAKNHKGHEVVDINKLNSKHDLTDVVNVPFPIKLHNVLQDIEKAGLESIASWQPHGRAFKIHKPKEFVKCVLAVNFKQLTFTSFQTQLNRYGFSRLLAGRDKGGYYHKSFLRDKPFLCKLISNTTMKSTTMGGVRNPQTEPDFYSMPPVLLEKEVDIKQANANIPTATINYPAVRSATNRYSSTIGDDSFNSLFTSDLNNEENDMNRFSFWMMMSFCYEDEDIFISSCIFSNINNDLPDDVLDFHRVLDQLVE